MLPDPATVFFDNTSILGSEDVVIRVVNPGFVDWNTQDDQGRPRITNQAFQDFPEERCLDLGVPARSMSVGLEPVLSQHGFSAEKMLELWDETYGLAAISGRDLRGCEQGVVGWPTEVEPWHGLVFASQGNKRTVSKQKCLARAAEWLIVPPRRGA